MGAGPRNCALLADRHVGLVEGVRGLLEACFATVVMVSDEASLMEAASRVLPEVVVVDLSLSRRSHLGWLREIKDRAPGTKVVAVGVHDEECVRQAVLPAGADAFVLKREMATRLLDVLSAVRSGSAGDGS